jgi:hypothetical protein
MQTVSRPPEDGRPGLAQVNLNARDVNASGIRTTIEHRARTRLFEHSRRGTTRDLARELPTAPCGDLTFDMSGGGRPAKLAGRRPLDGGVRFTHAACLACEDGGSAMLRATCSADLLDTTSVLERLAAWQARHGASMTAKLDFSGAACTGSERCEAR